MEKLRERRPARPNAAPSRKAHIAELDLVRGAMTSPACRVRISRDDEPYGADQLLLKHSGLPFEAEAALLTP